MLPPGHDTARTEQLRQIINAATPEELSAWPQPTNDDAALVGTIVIQYGYIDYNLQRIAEGLELSDNLTPRRKGKTAKLNAWDLSLAIQESPVWAGPEDIEILKLVEEYRPFRNLVAHSLMRRFPTENAYAFFVKSRKDFKSILGRYPEPEEDMTGVVAADELAALARELEKLVKCLRQVNMQIWK